MGAVGTKLVADLRRRRLQAVVLAVVLFMATAAATLALTILVESTAPFDRAFERANGAHLVIDYRGSTSTDALAATTSAPSVTSSAGPWMVADAGLAHPLGGSFDDTTVSARTQPDASIDGITISSGRWWQVPGEVVLDLSAAASLDATIGDTVSFRPLPRAMTSKGTGGDTAPVPLRKPPEGEPGPVLSLTVVGVAASVSTPDTAGWMSPTDVTALATGGTPNLQMLYRVAPSASQADLAAATAALTADLPADSMVASRTYLDTKAGVSEVADLYVPVLLAFSIFALLAAAFTIANVVSGIVLTSYRDIGVMKAIGYTPGQVSTILVAEILVPVAIGAAAGVLVGMVAAVPTVESTSRSFGLPGAVSFSPTVTVAVLIGTLAIAILAALGPSVRAGRASAVGAISHGTAPSTRPDGGRLRRLGLRLPFGAPARLGIAAGVAHPVRAAMTLGAILVGVAAVTFAIGLNASLIRVIGQIDRTEASPVRAQLVDLSFGAREATAAIAANTGTDRFVAIGRTDATVAGLGVLPFVGYDGDAGWIGFELISGRWFAGPGEVVAPTNFFTRTGSEIGDLITVSAGDRTLTLRLVGEIFDTGEEGPDNLVLRGAWPDLAAMAPAIEATAWEIRPKAGVAPRTFIASLQATTGDRLGAYTLSDSTTDAEFLLFLSVVATMGVVLVTVSVGGVFNTVLLETRQRTREVAVLKTVGLTPRQVVAMVLASIVPVGVIAGLMGVPLGLAFQRAVLTHMAGTVALTAVPSSTFDVFPPLLLVGLCLSGLAIGAAGAYLPAWRAARAPIATVLQAE